MMSLKSVCRLPPWTHWCVNKEKIVDFYSQCELTVSESWKGNDFWNFTVQKKKDALLMSGAEPEFVFVRCCKNLEDETQTVDVLKIHPNLVLCPDQVVPVWVEGSNPSWLHFFLLADRVNGNQQSSSSCLVYFLYVSPLFHVCSLIGWTLTNSQDLKKKIITEWNENIWKKKSGRSFKRGSVGLMSGRSLEVWGLCHQWACPLLQLWHHFSIP